MRQTILQTFVKNYLKRFVSRASCLPYQLGAYDFTDRGGTYNSFSFNGRGSCSFNSSQAVYSDRKINYITPLFLRAEQFTDSVALQDQNGTYLYGDLVNFSHLLADKVLYDAEHIGNESKKKKLNYFSGVRVALLCENDASYVVALLAAWMCSACAVPLCNTHPQSELEYIITNSNSRVIITTERYAPSIESIAAKHNVLVVVMEDKFYKKQVHGQDANKTGLETSTYRSARELRNMQILQKNKYMGMKALMVYTSGTTGKPKGVVHTYCSLQAQMEGMISAWEWTAGDKILHVLPLHHVHGIVNALMTPLYCGATCIMMPKFNAQEAWNLLTSPLHKINVFMAVPTIYAKLIAHLEEQFDSTDMMQSFDYVKATCTNNFRLMVSGSAALPEPVMNKWEQLTGIALLERYGMTEVGMALTNPLHGHRLPGSVGVPFPNVEVQIVKLNAYKKNGYDVLVQGNSQRTIVTQGCREPEGELLIRGPSIFSNYHEENGSRKLTHAEFTADGWFKTGDTASYKDGVYRIMGRTSVDIIKSGGFKISALDIEATLLAHENIEDIAVVGVHDMTWGQNVSAIVVLKDRSKVMILEQLRDWAKDKLAPYQLPTMLKVLEEMPRNAMGKVNKKELLKIL